MLVHLFPTLASLLLAMSFLLEPSWDTALAYALMAAFGGFVSAVETMATDNVQFASLRKGVRKLDLRSVELAGVEDLLPPVGLNYVMRRLRKLTRHRNCMFFNVPHQVMQHALAFRFARFYPVCLHSLGDFGTSASKSLILYHELGHLFTVQPRGGYITLVFGTALPLYWLLYIDGGSPAWTWALLSTVCVLELLSLALLNGRQREVMADRFAIACKLTELTASWAGADFDAAKQRGYFFEKPPASIEAYGAALLRHGRSRQREWWKAYEAMNRFDWLNRLSHRFDKETGGSDLYWRETFYRKALPNVILTPRGQMAVVKLVLVVFLAIQLTHVASAGEIWPVALVCAVVPLIVLALSARLLDETSTMFNQAKYGSFLSSFVVEEAIDDNVSRARRRQENEDFWKSWEREDESKSGGQRP